MKHLILFLLFPLGLSAQTFPEYSHLYSPDEIPTIKIEIDSDSLETLYLEENWYENHEYLSTFIFETDEISDTLYDVGLRFRGNTSRDKIKKSFKVSFNTYLAGRKYFGVEKLNLNAEVNDPSMIRSRLNWDLYRENKVPASRSNHIELYINGEYYGLYQNIEHIDEEFANTYYQNNTGNLYKCSYPANLDFISSNPDDYKVAPWGTRTYDLRINEELDDYSDLAEFIGFLNLSSDEEMECELPEYFNVYTYLKTAALDVLTGNWDGYIYNQNNFYLYHNDLTGQFEYIPYDTDNTWGIDWLNRNWSNRNIYTWSQTGQPRPLFNRLMGIEKYRDIFSWHIEKILNHSFSDSEYALQLESMHDFITASALNDPYRPLDFGYSSEDFLNSLDQAWGGHVDFSILDFMQIRTESAYSQLENANIAPIISKVETDFRYFPDSIIFKAFTEGPAATDVILEYSINEGVQQSQAFQSGSSIHSFALEIPEDYYELEFNVQASFQGNTRWAYCQNQRIVFDQSGLVFNEVMSSNDNTISDEFSEFDDWIELYNNSDFGMGTSGYFLSDNNTSSVKWALQEVIVPAGSFPLFWADKSIEQGSFHTNFRLSAEGERIYLFKRQENVLTLCDYLEIPPLPTDFSFGRLTDGSGEWVLFDNPTPESTNEGTLNTIEQESKSVLAYPNPTDRFVYLEDNINYRVFDVSGRMISEGNGSRIDLLGHSEGLYIIEFEGKRQKILLAR